MGERNPPIVIHADILVTGLSLAAVLVKYTLSTLHVVFICATLYKMNTDVGKFLAEPNDSICNIPSPSPSAVQSKQVKNLLSLANILEKGNTVHVVFKYLSKIMLQNRGRCMRTRSNISTPHHHPQSTYVCRVQSMQCLAHGGRWSNRTCVALALFSLLATWVVF
jgi:hypothetical protein